MIAVLERETGTCEATDSKKKTKRTVPPIDDKVTLIYLYWALEINFMHLYSHGMKESVAGAEHNSSTNTQWRLSPQLWKILYQLYLGCKGQYSDWLTSKV